MGLAFLLHMRHGGSRVKRSKRFRESVLHSGNGAFREPVVNIVLPSRVDVAELKEIDESLPPRSIITTITT